MTPEKNDTTSSGFTVRLGFGSVILAAVITFVGLAWIFFLGVMVGRMYYGNHDATNAQTPPSVQQNAPLSPQHMANGQDHTSDTVQNKTSTTYQPIIKEDKRLDQINQGSNTFEENTHENDTAVAQNSVVPNSVPQAPVADTTDTDGKETPVDDTSTTPAPLSDNSASKDEQGADFIEKVDDILQKKASPNTDAPQDVTTDAAPKQDSNDKLGANASTNTQKKNDTTASQDDTKLPAVKTTTEAKEPVYKYTYQLATFKNAENADITVKKLRADNINATILQEEKNGSIMYYILVHNTGTESSQKELVKKFAQHQFTNFIMRRSAVK